MAPGGPPGAGRGRGGKFKNFKRGGGKQFSRHLQPLDAEGNEFKEKNEDEASSSSEEESEESEEEASEKDTSQSKNMTREERRAAAKITKMAAIAKKKGRVIVAGDMPSSSEDEDEDDPMPANPNHTRASRNQTRISPADIEKSTKSMKDLNIGVTGRERPKPELSRREREAIQAQQARENYRKLNEAGKTDEAKADLARLMLIREKRQAEAARKEAEREVRLAAETAKKLEISAHEAKRREAALGPSKSKGKSKK